MILVWLPKLARKKWLRQVCSGSKAAGRRTQNTTARHLKAARQWTHRIQQWPSWLAQRRRSDSADQTNPLLRQ